MDDRIVESERIIQLAIAKDIEDRRKRLLEDDAFMRVYLDNRRADIDAAMDCLDKLSFALKGALHAFERGLVDQRTDERAGIARIANPNLIK